MDHEASSEERQPRRRSAKNKRPRRRPKPASTNSAPKTGRRGTRYIFWLVIILSWGYAVYPYYGTQAFFNALNQGDAHDLELRVDWESVGSSVVKQLAVHTGGDLIAVGWAALGAGSPEGLRNLLLVGDMSYLVSSDYAPPSHAKVSFSGVQYAFFTTPTIFRVEVAPIGRDDEEPMTLRFSFRDWMWRLVRRQNLWDA